MSDEELAALERAAREKGDATALRYARALERLGRSELEVIAALALGRDDLEVRKVLAARTTETLPRRVRERWTVKLPGRDQFQLVLATTLGIVCSSKQRVVVLDPDSGKVRHERLAGDVFVAGTALLIFSSSHHLVGYDLWTGEELFAKKIQGKSAIAVFGHGLFVTAFGRDVVLLRFSSEREAPSPAWRARGQVAIPGPRLVALQVEAGLVAAHDTTTGKELWRAAGVAFRSDDEGVLVLETARLDPRVVAYDLEGREAWARHGRFVPYWPPRTDDALAMHEWRNGQLEPVLLDRKTGEPVRDERLILIEAFPEIAAKTALGEQAWTWREPGASRLHALAAGGRVYVGVGMRSLTCLEEDG